MGGALEEPHMRWDGVTVTIGARRDQVRQWHVAAWAQSDDARLASRANSRLRSLLRQECDEQQGDVAGTMLHRAQDDAADWVQSQMPGAEVWIVRQ